MIVTYLAPDYAIMFVLHLICMIYTEGKWSKMQLYLYQVINQQCQWVKIGEFARSITILR